MQSPKDPENAIGGGGGGRGEGAPDNVFLPISVFHRSLEKQFDSIASRGGSVPFLRKHIASSAPLVPPGNNSPAKRAESGLSF